MHVLSVLRRTVTTAAALAAAVVPALALAPAAHADQARALRSGFTVYTNERNVPTPGLENFGAVRSTVAYDYFHLTCDAAGCYSDGGALPTEDAYKAKILDYVQQFHGGPTDPVVLDFEPIALTEVSGPAATNAFALWKQLIHWTHEAMPKAPVGAYGYDWKTTNIDLVKKLHAPGLLDFFAPRAYFDKTPGMTGWNSNLDGALANDHAIAPGQPVVPYISPSFSGNTGTGYLDGTQIDTIFATLKARTQGVVVWEPDAKGPAACGWFNAFSANMGTLTNTASHGPLTAKATTPGGDCTVPAGATTTVPVTFTNTSSAATAATTVQAPGGLPAGWSVTWSDTSVPALAPGAAWTTSFTVTAPAAGPDNTALLHQTTGLGDTRFAMVAY
ncbi:NEW3 domain-containing protein [Streptomyces murinus]|uniref:Alpha-galactosidase NEW3 domain-containing protein n=1 Tax=Streptomyces murinus TaxID=33900 RepID=A0A7W3NSQ3_STRMR|nr:NEW3 domain-containing protein [Streptomyces murinus]MBA9055967.1 hypothetical protein [Streptomyces murinus]UWW90491.1 hypothetical protein GO605_06190 [Streptomyces murinus]WSI87715.1 NEW3 domain-containing protein [Streptomyces murinus]